MIIAGSPECVSDRHLVGFTCLLNNLVSVDSRGFIITRPLQANTTRAPLIQDTLETLHYLGGCTAALKDREEMLSRIVSKLSAVNAHP